jgi:hypothetical protein
VGLPSLPSEGSSVFTSLGVGNVNQTIMDGESAVWKAGRDGESRLFHESLWCLCLLKCFFGLFSLPLRGVKLGAGIKMLSLL